MACIYLFFNWKFFFVLSRKLNSGKEKENQFCIWRIIKKPVLLCDTFLNSPFKL